MYPDARQTPELGELEREYTVVREIGRGATAVVYLAQRIDDGCEVAVKILKDGWGGGTVDQIALSAHESETLARLRHRNIVGYRGRYVTSEGSIALVMEYVNGDTLRQLLIQHPRPPFDAVDAVLRDVASALVHAHAHNVVHYDVKPENIFIDAANNRALLSDFGIATSMLAAGTPDVPGLVAGTPRYMSPEQINGAPPDTRSDLYSLGMVGWEMLAGVPPWTGESIQDILFSQKNEALPDLRVLRPDAPRRLILAVEGALHKDLRFRLSSATEFLVQLDHDTATGSSAQSRRFIQTSPLPAAQPRRSVRRSPVDAASETLVVPRGGSSEALTETFVLQQGDLEFPITVPPREAGTDLGSFGRRWWVMGALGVGAIVLGGVVVTRASWGEKRPASTRTAPVNVARAARSGTRAETRAGTRAGARAGGAELASGVLVAPTTAAPGTRPPVPPVVSPVQAPVTRSIPQVAALPPSAVSATAVRPAAPSPVAAAPPPSPPRAAPPPVNQPSATPAPGVAVRPAASGARTNLPAPAVPMAAPRGGRVAAPSPASERTLRAAEIARAEAAARAEATATLLRTALGAYTTATTLGNPRSPARTGGLRRARELLTSAAQVQPTVPDIYLLRARVTADLGDLRDAWGDAETATRLGRWWEGEAMTVIVDVAARDTAGASARAAGLLKRARQRAEALTAEEGRYLALALTAVGDRSGAIEALQLIDPRDKRLAAVLQDPGLARLRSDARFVRLGAARRR